MIDKDLSLEKDLGEGNQGKLQEKEEEGRTEEGR